MSGVWEEPPLVPVDEIIGAGLGLFLVLALLRVILHRVTR